MDDLGERVDFHIRIRGSRVEAELRITGERQGSGTRGDDWTVFDERRGRTAGNIAEEDSESCGRAEGWHDGRVVRVEDDRKSTLNERARHFQVAANITNTN